MPGKLISCSLKEQLTCHNVLPLQKIPFRCQNTTFKHRSLHRRWTAQCAEKPSLLPPEDVATTWINIALHKVRYIWGLIAKASTPSPLPHSQIDVLKSSGIVLSQKLPHSLQILFSYSLILLHTSTHYTSTPNFICDANPHGVLL